LGGAFVCAGAETRGASDEELAVCSIDGGVDSAGSRCPCAAVKHAASKARAGDVMQRRKTNTLRLFFSARKKGVALLKLRNVTLTINQGPKQKKKQKKEFFVAVELTREMKQSTHGSQFER
jgi:hypothetical protein